MTRDEQADLLRANGFVDPAGPITGPESGDFLVGQWLRKAGSDAAFSNHLLLSSRMLQPQEAFQLLNSLGEDDVYVTEEEVRQQMLALPGLKEDEAAQRALLQRLAVYLRVYLGASVPDLTGVYIDTIDGRLGLVVKVARSTSDAEGLIGGAIGGVSPTFVVGDHSRAELRGLTAKVVEALGIDALPLDEAESVYEDPRTETVVVEPNTNGRTSDQLRTWPGLESLVADGTIEFRAPRTAERTAIYGGVGTTAASDCTWGFNVGVSGNPGMVTAEHCDNNEAYGYIPMTYVVGDTHPWVDAQRHDYPDAVNGEVSNQIVRAFDTNLAITSRTMWADIDVNDTVCKQGRASGYACGGVNATNVGNNRFVRFGGADMTCVGGDSGGPTFYGNSAYGLTSFASGPNAFGNNDDGFGAIEYAEVWVGFTVWTK